MTEPLLISGPVKLGSSIEQLKSSVEGVGVRESTVRDSDGQRSRRSVAGRNSQDQGRRLDVRGGM